MEELLKQISTELQAGHAPAVKALVSDALEKGADPMTVLNDGLMAGMTVVGTRFRNNEIYVPEVLIAARAMNMGAAVLKPYLPNAGDIKGTVVLGTVQGDLHDIGKNLVKMLMESRGLQVYDLGIDVPAQAFVDEVRKTGAKIVAMSALLTTTMPQMGEVIKALSAAGLRDQVKIMVGGAPVTEQFASSIGADAYTPDAMTCAEQAALFCASQA